MMNKDCIYLPADIITLILLRLPIWSIIQCKYVCKTLRDLIESCEFRKVHSHNSKPVPGLAALDQCSNLYNFYKFVEYGYSLKMPHLSIAMKFTLPIDHEHVLIHSSVNGLLLFSDARTHESFVCNPITRDYIMLPSPCPKGRGSFGFGVSKMRGEYKIVRVLPHDDQFEVYTLGTESWRSVAPACSYNHKGTPTFLNGNLHWLLSDSQANVFFISCFDLDTELFTTFSPPPPPRVPRVDECHAEISAFEECLAFCYPSRGEGFVIWLMNEYGDNKSWTRKFIITYGLGCEAFFHPIKVYKEDSILITRNSCSTALLYFYKDKNTIEFSEPCYLYFHGNRGWREFSYTLSFLSLKTFSAENVCSF